MNLDKSYITQEINIEDAKKIIINIHIYFFTYFEKQATLNRINSFRTLCIVIFLKETPIFPFSHFHFITVHLLLDFGKVL